MTALTETAEAITAREALEKFLAAPRPLGDNAIYWAGRIARHLELVLDRIDRDGAK